MKRKNVNGVAMRLFVTLLCSLFLLDMQMTAAEKASEKNEKTTPIAILGYEVGAVFLNFTKETVDGVKPDNVYGQAPFFQGLKLQLPFHTQEENNKYLYIKILRSASEETEGDKTYSTTPTVSIFGAHIRNPFPHSNWSLLLTAGLAFIDTGVVKVKDKTTDTTSYTKGPEFTRLSFEVGSSYFLNKSWDIDMLFNWMTALGDDNTYLQDSFGFLVGVNYHFETRGLN